MTELQAGWFADPSGDASKLRYWDGTQWTDHYADAVAAPAAPVQPAEPAQPVQPAQPYEQAQPQYAPQGAPQPQYAPQAAPAPVYAPQAPPQKKKKTLLFIIIGAAVLVIVAVVLIFAVIKPFSSNTSTNTPPAITDPVNNTPPNNTTTTPPADAFNNSNNNTNTNTNTNTNITVPPIEELSGDVTGQVGTTYATRWFDFTFNAMYTTQTYESITAASGNTLVVANITITNTFGSPQPFGTFDWFVDSASLPTYLDPLDPVSANMMPLNFTVDDGETVTYDVVVEMPANLNNAFFMYIEVSSTGDVYTSFKIPIK